MVLADESGQLPTIAWFVSGHGLGHATRATQIMEHIPASRARVLVFSMADAEFIRHEARRPVEVRREAWDHGPVQASNFAIDWAETFRRCTAAQSEAQGRVGDLEQMLRREGVGVVVCDVVPLPLRVAKSLAIPSVLVANFTWNDVMGGETRGRADNDALLATYAADYANADVVVRTRMSFALDWATRREDVGVIGRRGRERREELRRAVQAAPGDKIVPVYLGLWGTDDLRLDCAARIPGVRFVSYRPHDDLVAVVSPSEWPFEDLVASSDAVLCKPGFGALSACMSNGVPCVYYPRPEFSEYGRLKCAMDEWGGGVCLELSKLMAGAWGEALREAMSLSPQRVNPVGGAQAAGIILNMLKK